MEFLYGQFLVCTKSYSLFKNQPAVDCKPAAAATEILAADWPVAGKLAAEWLLAAAFAPAAAIAASFVGCKTY